MTHKEFNFDFYNTKFYGQYWEAKNTKAVVVLAHGMGEHSSRYKYVAKKLTDNNFSVVAFDHFGHGKTEGKRGHNPNFEAVLESISKVIEKARKLFPEKPVFLYGHSMGGNAVVNYSIRKEHQVKGIIATSPFLKLAFKPSAIKLFVGRMLQNIAPSLTMGNELDVKTGEWAIENADKLKTPMFLLHGTADSIIDYKGTEKFANNSKNATLKLYKGGFHELHNDLCKEEMLQDIVDWLDAQLSFYHL